MSEIRGMRNLVIAEIIYIADELGYDPFDTAYLNRYSNVELLECLLEFYNDRIELQRRSDKAIG